MLKNGINYNFKQIAGDYDPSRHSKIIFFPKDLFFTFIKTLLFKKVFSSKLHLNIKSKNLIKIYTILDYNMHATFFTFFKRFNAYKNINSII
jgi:hypothetical protein